MILKTGLQEIVLQSAPATSGVLTKDISVQSDAALFLLWVNSTSGSLTIEIYGILGDENKEVFLLSFPVITQPTIEILQKRTGTIPTRLRVKATFTDACNFELAARAVSTGSSDTKILGGSTLTIEQKTVTTITSILLSASAVDRTSVAIKNWSTSGTIYVAETATKANPLQGWPIGPKDALGLDIQAGVQLYATADTGSCDIRIIESGG